METTRLIVLGFAFNPATLILENSQFARNKPVANALLIKIVPPHKNQNSP